jgi:predicted acylesterase/phospholipase RssA
MEVALVRACIDSPGWLSVREEAQLRYALSLSRLTEVRTGDGRDVDLTELTAALRLRLTDTLSPLLLDRRGLVERPEIASLLPIVVELAREHRERLQLGTRDLLPWADVDREIREKALVLACGGGGGTGYVYLGAFHALEERGIVPSLLSGTSIGSILAAFRARRRSFDVSEVAEVVKDLAWASLFRPISIHSRYGLPAPLRLYLRDGVGRHFDAGDGGGMRMEDLAIPLLITVAGIRREEMPHEPEWYEHRLDLGAAVMAPQRPGIRWTRQVIGGLWRTLSDFVQRPEMLRPVVIGADATTRGYDVLDAMGFSSAVPGLIHYDVTRDDPRMATLLDELFERQGLLRLVDGGLVDNVPARAAWRSVASGRLGRRNALVVALDAFAPKLTQPLWMPIQRLARPNVLRNLRYAHVAKTFTHTLSPLDLVPSQGQISKAIRWGRSEFAHELPLIERLLAPLPDLD